MRKKVLILGVILLLTINCCVLFFVKDRSTYEMELDKGNVENLKGTLSEGPSEDVGDEPWIFKISCDDDVIMPLPPLADGDEPLL